MDKVATDKQGKETSGYPALCDYCHKLLSSSELLEGGGASWVNVRETEITYREIESRCAACTYRYGPLLPKQNVSGMMGCCGVT